MTLPCLILAAGFGTRMGALTRDRPKPLIEVAGRPLLDHALMAAQGAAPIIVNTHYRAEQIAAHLAGHAITLQHETPEILDSGGAVKRAAQEHDGPIATLNADNVWTGDAAFAQLRDAFDPIEMKALLLLVPRRNAVGRTAGGDFAMDPDGRLRFDQPDGDYVYTGAQILDPALCKQDPRDVFSLRDVWHRFADQGRLYGLVHRGHWADVGHPAGIPLAEKMLHVI